MSTRMMAVIVAVFVAGCATVYDDQDQGLASDDVGDLLPGKPCPKDKPRVLVYTKVEWHCSGEPFHPVPQSVTVHTGGYAVVKWKDKPQTLHHRNGDAIWGDSVRGDNGNDSWSVTGGDIGGGTGMFQLEENDSHDWCMVYAEVK